MNKSLFQILSEANTEEELKNFFAKRFKIKLATKNFIDLYTQQILFEFKLDKNLKNPQILRPQIEIRKRLSPRQPKYLHRN